METPILCPQCGTQIAIREQLPPNQRSAHLECPKCGLGLEVDTTVEGGQ